MAKGKCNFNIHLWFMRNEPHYHWMPCNDERLNYLDKPETKFIAVGMWQYHENARKLYALKEEKNEDQTENC